MYYLLIPPILLLFMYLGYPLFLLIYSKFQTNKKKSLLKEKHKVSIIMCAYNEEKNIENKLNNILELDYDINNIELIIVNDASTDNTSRILKKVLKNLPIKNILIENIKREGKPKSINKGIKNSSNNYIVLTDVTPILHEQALNNVSPKLRKRAFSKIPSHRGCFKRRTVGTLQAGKGVNGDF